MSKIFKRPGHVSQLPRHGHDLSRRLLFTSSTGHILPVLHDFLSPGDKVFLNDSIFTRTQPVKTPAFVRVSEHIYYFFVPLRQLDPYFEQAFYGINDFTNSNDLRSPVPIQNQEFWVSSGAVTNLTPSVMFGVPLSVVLYNFFSLDSNSSSTMYYDSISNGVYSRYLRVHTSSSTTEERYRGLDIFNQPKVWGALRLLHMLDFGSNITENLTFSGSDPSAVGFGNNIANKYVNLYTLAAYQKIWYDYFRLGDYIPNSVSAYNIGAYMRPGSNSTFEKSDLYNFSRYDYHGMFELHYHPLKKDYFTGVLPTPQHVSMADPDSFDFIGSSASLDDWRAFNTLLLNQYGVDPLTTLPTATNGENKPNLGSDVRSNQRMTGAVKSTMYDPDSTVSSEVLNTNAVRMMFAYERMMMITRFAGKHYDDQTLAHFGFRVPKGVSSEVYYLGGHTSTLKIGEVVATAAGAADSDNTSILGELAGRGVGMSSRNRDIKFTAPCHGILMALYAAVPEIEYKSFGIDRFNLYTSINHFPHPEFDKVGFQQFYGCEAFNGSSADVGYSGNMSFGVNYRWMELKTSYDRVYGAFLWTLRDWSSSIVFGQFSQGSFENAYMSAFYCPPTYLDSIMPLSFNPPYEEGVTFPDSSDKAILLGTSESSGSQSLAIQSDLSKPFTASVMYQRDPLLHSLDIKYYKSSWMSLRSLPNL